MLKRLVGFILIGIMVILMALVFRGVNNQLARPAPKPYEISFSGFPGRILSEYEVHPGTFTIKKSFEETWSRDAIMVFGLLGESKIRVKIWRPDPITLNVFQYAEKEFFPSGERWNLYHIDKIIENNKILYAMPAFLMTDFVIAISLFSFAIVALFGGSGYWFIKSSRVKR